MTLAHVVIFLIRFGLVALFLPFSAIDKLLDFSGAVKQAEQDFPPQLARMSIFLGIGVEVFMSLGVLTGVFDRLSAMGLALYCVATACLFKQFWRHGDFWKPDPSQDRTLFWDFLKNFSVASGFLLVVVGTSGADLETFITNPMASSHPYAATPQP